MVGGGFGKGGGVWGGARGYMKPKLQLRRGITVASWGGGGYTPMAACRPPGFLVTTHARPVHGDRCPVGGGTTELTPPIIAGYTDSCLLPPVCCLRGREIHMRRSSVPPGIVTGGGAANYACEAKEEHALKCTRLHMVLREEQCGTMPQSCRKAVNPAVGFIMI